MPSFNKGSYTEYSNKIGLYSNNQESFISQSPDVVLNFPYKDCVLEGGMTKEDAKRDERFLNIKLDKRDIDTLFDPKILTNFKYIDSNGEHELSADDDIEFFDKNGELKQNLLIKGNNLIALHTLKEKLAGKVKLIYIDPPYNTGNDGFKYNDSFNHSAWLTFMENRLKIAKPLLCENGAIFISCDDNEHAYLKVLCDEIFGRDNYAASFPWRKRTAKSDVPFGISQDYEYILCYAQTSKFKAKIASQKRKYYESPDFPGEPWRFHDLTQQKTAKERPNSYFDIIDPETGRRYSANPNAVWRITRDTIHDYLRQNRIIFPGKYDFLKISKPVLRYWYSEDKRKAGDDFGCVAVSTQLPSSIGMTMDGSKENFALFGAKVFAFPKPESLISYLVQISTDPGDIVLDFCLGSGTTAAVAHKMGRRWIGVEQMDYIETIAKERLKKVVAGEQGGISKSANWQGGGSFVYMELKKYNQEYVDQINAATNMTELEEVYKRMCQNAFLKFWFDKKTFERDERFRSMDLNTRKQALISILDENQLYLNYADMDDAKYHVSDDERALTKRFYGDDSDDSNDTEAGD